MKAQLVAIITAIITGIQQVFSSPWKVLLFILAVLVVKDLFTPSSAKVIPAVIGYVDALAKKVTLNLIVLVAIVLALRR